MEIYYVLTIVAFSCLFWNSPFIYFQKILYPIHINFFSIVYFICRFDCPTSQKRLLFTPAAEFRGDLAAPFAHLQVLINGVSLGRK